MITLQPVSTSDGREFYDMLQRIRPENGFENSAFAMDYADFPAWLAKRVDMSQGVGLEDWQVPATTYWLMDNGVPVGTGNLRHQLTDALREAGGNIGYAVDDSKRGRGYGKALLHLLLEEARRRGMMEDILVTVHLDNIASRRVAEACGGQLRRETEKRVYYWFSAQEETINPG